MKISKVPESSAQLILYKIMDLVVLVNQKVKRKLWWIRTI